MNEMGLTISPTASSSFFFPAGLEPRTKNMPVSCCYRNTTSLLQGSCRWQIYSENKADSIEFHPAPIHCLLASIEPLVQPTQILKQAPCVFWRTQKPGCHDLVDGEDLHAYHCVCVEPFLPSSPVLCSVASPGCLGTGIQHWQLL